MVDLLILLDVILSWMDKLRNGVKKRLNSRSVNTFLIAFVVLSVSVGSIIFWNWSKKMERSLVEQMLHRQQIVARATAKSLESFFVLAGNSLSLLATRDSVVSPSDETQEILNLFVQEWANAPLVSIALTDSEGTVVASANRQSSVGEVGASLAERDYFKWGKGSGEKGKLFVGELVFGNFGSVKDKPMIPVATAVFDEDEFKGVLITPVLISELTRVYLEPLRISQDTRAHLGESTGLMLSSFYPEFIGKNIFEIVKSMPAKGGEAFASRLRDIIQKEDEGKFEVDAFSVGNINPTDILVAVSPVHIRGVQQKSTAQDKIWFLAVVTPKNDALAFFPQFHFSQFYTLIAFVFVVLGLVFLSILAIRISQREAYYDGFSKGRDTGILWQDGKGKIKKDKK